MTAGAVETIIGAEHFLDGGTIRSAIFELSCRGSRGSAPAELLNISGLAEAPCITVLFYIADVLDLPVVRPEIDLGSKRKALCLAAVEPPSAVSASGGLVKYVLKLRLLYYESPEEENG